MPYQNNAFIIKTYATWWQDGGTLVDEKNNSFFIWSKGKCDLYLCEYLIEILPKNKILRFFKELYWDYLRIVYKRMIKRL